MFKALSSSMPPNPTRPLKRTFSAVDDTPTPKVEDHQVKGDDESGGDNDCQAGVDDDEGMSKTPRGERPVEVKEWL